MTELAGQRALVTGGGRGIGENIARELAAAGAEVGVSGRMAEQVDAVAAAIGGRALVGHVTRREDVERWFAELGPVDLLVANAGTGNRGVSWELDPAEWWQVFEVNVLGVHLCCNAVIPGMLERGRGRVVIVGSGASYLPGATDTSYTSSKAAVCRYGETLANALADRIPVFVISPGLVRTAMTERALPGRRALDSCGVRPAARPEARRRRLRRARRSLPPRGAQRRRRAGRAHRRGPGARSAGDPPASGRGFRPIIENL